MGLDLGKIGIFLIVTTVIAIFILGVFGKQLGISMGIGPVVAYSMIIFAGLMIALGGFKIDKFPSLIAIGLIGLMVFFIIKGPSVPSLQGLFSAATPAGTPTAASTLLINLSVWFKAVPIWIWLVLLGGAVYFIYKKK